LWPREQVFQPPLLERVIAHSTLSRGIEPPISLDRRLDYL
jgi:hypothetical protein